MIASPASIKNDLTDTTDKRKAGDTKSMRRGRKIGFRRLIKRSGRVIQQPAWSHIMNKHLRESECPATSCQPVPLCRILRCLGVVVLIR